MRLTRFKLLFILSCISVVVIFARTGGIKSLSSSYRSQSKKVTPANNSYLKVTRVVDGDTIEIEGGWKVRYIGINAPESVAPSRPVECYGHEAALYNRELVEGQIVRLVKDISDKDEYGRLLRYVYKGDDFINLRLVKDGYAKIDTFPPDVLYKKNFEDAENFALANHLGVWSNKCTKL